MGRKALPKDQVNIIKKKFRLSATKAEKLIRSIMEAFKIPCDDATRLLLAIKALRKRG